MRVDVKDSLDWRGTERSLVAHYANIRRRLKGEIVRPLQLQAEPPAPVRPREPWPPQTERPDSPAVVVDVPVLAEEQLPDPLECGESIIPPMQRGRIQSTIWLAAHMSTIPREDLIGDRRTALIVYWRQIAHFTARYVLAGTYPNIGRIWGRDHTTVLSSCIRMEKRMFKEPKTRKDLLEFMATIEASLSPDLRLIRDRKVAEWPQYNRDTMPLGAKIQQLQERLQCDFTSTTHQLKAKAYPSDDGLGGELRSCVSG